MHTKLTYSFIGATIVALLLSGCFQDEKSQTQVVANINSFQLSLDDFNKQLTSEIEFNPEFSLADASKKEFLDQIIRKELLIQEAKKMKLDREEKFMKTIERYWEATLIRNLMEKQGQEIVQKVVVSDQEIDSFLAQSDTKYMKMDQKEVRETVRQSLKKEKENKLMDEWIEGLINSADIKINQNILNQ